MMKKAFVAVDIGASSGRLILGGLHDNKLEMEEVHRFKNKMTTDGQHYHWDVDGLFDEIVIGLKKAAQTCEELMAVGVDTWAVDYVLVDGKGDRVAPVYAYRDHRTDGTMYKVFSVMNRERIYEKTGIQFLQFNTLYQLYEHLRNKKEDFDQAASMMLIPDYLHFKLSGVRSIEFTNATSTQMLGVEDKLWDRELQDLVGIDPKLMYNPVQPGSVLGGLKDEISRDTGIEGMKVIAPATHDTGSAVAAVPTNSKDYVYISSGTWSLMGIESDEPITSEKASAFNFTNEGGVFGTYRVLKNISGLWLIQEVHRIHEGKYSFADYVELAEEEADFDSLIDPSDERFLNPGNMIEEIQGYCRETYQKIPETPGQLARCIFESLACLYRRTLEQIKDVSDQSVNRIHIIGGGCQNKMLNQLCADYTDCEVHTGPIEATAIGNLVMQMIALGEIKDLASAREIIKNSFDIEIHHPNHNRTIEDKYEKFRRLEEQWVK